MDANIATISLQPGTLDHCVAILRALQPQLTEQPGFRRWLVLGDGAATVLSISLWASRADLDAAVSSAVVRQALAGLAPLLAGTPARQAYEVMLEVPGKA